MDAALELDGEMGLGAILRNMHMQLAAVSAHVMPLSCSRAC